VGRLLDVFCFGCRNHCLDGCAELPHLPGPFLDRASMAKNAPAAKALQKREREGCRFVPFLVPAVAAAAGSDLVLTLPRKFEDTGHCQRAVRI
jgi:hypothetical protein